MAKIKERGKAAVPPKKSASAYIIFTQEKRIEIQARDPMARVTEIVKEMSSFWNKMTKQETLQYRELAKKGKSFYLSYTSSLDKERYEQELKSLSALDPTLAKPKKCLSAYMIFVQEVRPPPTRC